MLLEQVRKQRTILKNNFKQKVQMYKKQTSQLYYEKCFKNIDFD